MSPTLVFLSLKGGLTVLNWASASSSQCQGVLERKHTDVYCTPPGDQRWTPACLTSSTLLNGPGPRYRHCAHFADEEFEAQRNEALSQDHPGNGGEVGAGVSQLSQAAKILSLPLRRWGTHWDIGASSLLLCLGHCQAAWEQWGQAVPVPGSWPACLESRSSSDFCLATLCPALSPLSSIPF